MGVLDGTGGVTVAALGIVECFDFTGGLRFGRQALPQSLAGLGDRLMPDRADDL